MNMGLKRSRAVLYGVFGTLFDESGAFLAVTLEHSYPQKDGSFLPKIPAGTYVCKRGEHRLEGMNQPFMTFEVTGVAGHSNLLFHWGNYNNDSEGCILLGTDAENTMITESRAAFARFMALQEGVDLFTLTVENQ